MSHFKEQVIDFGTMKRNSSKKFTFNAELDIPKIVDISVACGCTKVKYSEADRTLTVEYKAGNIPNQVLGNQAVHKTVGIQYKDGTSEELVIKGYKVR